MTLPSAFDAPFRLMEIDGNCGLLVAWVAFRHFGVRISCSDLIKACGHSRRYGVFTIALATALQERGLDVTFHSDPDPDIKPVERRFYSKARKMGTRLCSSQKLRVLLKHVKDGHFVVVFYQLPGGDAHFSALLGERSGRLLLPQSGSLHMPRDLFLRAWRAPGILRQSLVVTGRRPNKSAPGKRGTRVLFHTGRARPALPEHRRSA
jgi:hypothetical protein